MGYVHGEISSPFFILSNKMKGYNLHHICCNFLFTLSLSPLLQIIHSRNKIPSYIIEGFLPEKKNPKSTYFHHQICDIMNGSN